jgi:predicted nucleotidyltransferase
MLDPDTEHAVRAFLAKTDRQYDVTGAILFGSRARYGHRPDSDADVAVLLRGRPGEFVPNKLAMADIAYDVLLETGIRIQPLPVRMGASGGVLESAPAAQPRARRCASVTTLAGAESAPAAI